METLLNYAITFFSTVGITVTILFLIGKFKKPNKKLKSDFKSNFLSNCIKYDPILHFDKPYVDYTKYAIPEKPQLPTDIFNFYYAGEFISEIQRKDLEKIQGLYDLDEIKLILNKK